MIEVRRPSGLDAGPDRVRRRVDPSERVPSRSGSRGPSRRSRGTEARPTATLAVGAMGSPGTGTGTVASGMARRMGSSGVARMGSTTRAGHRRDPETATERIRTRRARRGGRPSPRAATAGRAFGRRPRPATPLPRVDADLRRGHRPGERLLEDGDRHGLRSDVVHPAPGGRCRCRGRIAGGSCRPPRGLRGDPVVGLERGSHRRRAVADA